MARCFVSLHSPGSSAGFQKKPTHIASVLGREPVLCWQWRGKWRCPRGFNKDASWCWQQPSWLWEWRVANGSWRLTTSCSDTRCVSICVCIFVCLYMSGYFLESRFAAVRKRESYTAAAEEAAPLCTEPVCPLHVRDGGVMCESTKEVDYCCG